MDWTKWITAGLLVMMIVFIFPRAKQMLKDSPKGSSGDWQMFAIIVVIITLFIFLLTQMV